MTKILIICALLKEAQALINQLDAKPNPNITQELWSEGVVPTCYHFSRGTITLSGMGIHAAQLTATQYAPFYDEIWNIGLAGCLNSSLAVGSLVSIERVGKYVPISAETLDPVTHQCLSDHLPALSLSNSGGRLISSDFPIHNDFHRSTLAPHWDLVDMEGYGIAYAAQRLKKPCKMWKLVSDFSSPGGRALIQKHLPELSEKLATHILTQLVL